MELPEWDALEAKVGRKPDRLVKAGHPIWWRQVGLSRNHASLTDRAGGRFERNG